MTQEEIWSKDLRESRLRLIHRVKQAMSTTSPTRRYALYTQWRNELGDVAAREQAKFAEAVIAGRISLRKIEDMV